MAHRISSPARTMEDPLIDSRDAELRTFLFLTAVLVPALAVAIVAGYGFLVWIFQLFAGPPTG